MKRFFFLTIAIISGIMLSAQTQIQQGYVKTKGRMVNGQLVPGQGLKGATVSVKGRTAVLVNADDGAFSFPIAETQFRLDSVNKKGYQLVDLDACPKTYKYSSNPLYIVMETPEQQLQDKLNAERKIRRNLQKQLQAKEDEIEALKEANKISQEEYQQALLQIYDEQENNEELISFMAKRYSELDYDQLDEFYRQISYYIENVELMKADSMLRSRGNIGKQVENILQRGQVLHEEKDKLKKAEAVHEADVEEAANRCKAFAETFFMQYQNDSAGYYYGLRAKLDTTRIDWQCEAGDFCFNYLAEYDMALSYYQRALRLAQQQPTCPNEQTASLYCMLGAVNSFQGQYQEALDFFNTSLSEYEELFGENYYGIADVYDYMGSLLYGMGNYQEALNCFNNALKINYKLYGLMHKDVATCHNNLGFLFSKTGDYEEAARHFDTALFIDETLLDPEHPSLAFDYNNVGQLYYLNRDFPAALKYYNKALDIFLKTLGDKHPNVASVYNNLANVYGVTNEYEKAIGLFEQALTIMETVLGKDHPTVANCYNNIGYSYMDSGNIEKALSYFDQAITIQLNTIGPNHPDIANTYMSIGSAKYRQKDYATSYQYYDKAYNILKDTLGESHHLTKIAKTNKDDCLKLLNDGK